MSSDAEPDPRLVDRLVDELRDVATLENAPASHGAFTLESDAARRKLRALRGETPSFWVLHVLRGFVRLGAGAVHVTGTSSFTMHVPGVELDLPVTEEASWHIVAGIGQGTDADALRPILLGALVGLNAGLGRVVVTSRGRRLTVGPDGIDCGAAAGGDGSLTVRGDGRPEPLVDGRRTELWALLKRGRGTGLKLFFDGVLLDGAEHELSGLAPGEREMHEAWLVSARRELEGVFVRGAWIPWAPGEIRLEVDGVWIETIRDPGFANENAISIAGDFRLDAGLQRCVRDPCLDRALELVQQGLREQALPAPTSQREDMRGQAETAMARSARWFWQPGGSQQLPLLSVGTVVALGVPLWAIVRTYQLLLRSPDADEVWAGILLVTILLSFIAWVPPVLGMMVVGDSYRARRALTKAFPPHHACRGRWDDGLTISDSRLDLFFVGAFALLAYAAYAWLPEIAPMSSFAYTPTTNYSPASFTLLLVKLPWTAAGAATLLGGAWMLFRRLAGHAPTFQTPGL